jgi:hypothetical protein
MSADSFYFVTFAVFGQKPRLREPLDAAGSRLSSGWSSAGRRSVTCGGLRLFRGGSRLSHPSRSSHGSLAPRLLTE